MPARCWIIAHDAHRIAYLSDTRGLPEETFATLEAGPLDLIVLDCAYPQGVPGARNHNDLDEAAAIITRLPPHQTRLTHLNHELDEYSAASTVEFKIARDHEAVEIGAQSR